MAKVEFSKIVGSKHFSGASKIHSDDSGALSNVLSQQLHKEAQIKVAGESITDLTDSSGGTAGGFIAEATIPAETDVSGGTTGVTAASINTSLDTVMDAYAVILEQANLALAALGVALPGEGPGNIALSGTIAVIDDTASSNTNDTDSADFATTRTALEEVLTWQSTVFGVIEVVRAAVSAESMAGRAGAVRQGAPFAGLDGGTAAITNSVSSADAVSSLLLTEFDAFVDVLSDNVAEFALRLDGATGVTAVLDLEGHVSGQFGDIDPEP